MALHCFHLQSPQLELNEPLFFISIVCLSYFTTVAKSEYGQLIGRDECFTIDNSKHLCYNSNVSVSLVYCRRQSISNFIVFLDHRLALRVKPK